VFARRAPVDGLGGLFKHVLDYCLPESVAVLGVAGGNGLEQIDCVATKRIVGIDINHRYLDEVQRRFGSGQLAGLELYCRDLAEPDLRIAPIGLVHAALIFEHAGLGVALENALIDCRRVRQGKVVLQLPNEDEQGVTSTNYASMQTLKPHFALIDIREFQRLLRPKGFELVGQEHQLTSAGKTLWLGVFAQNPPVDAGKLETLDLA
jgi:hypothetical protein